MRVVPAASACGSTRAALKKDFEEALLAAAPDAESLSVEFAEPAPALSPCGCRREQRGAPRTVAAMNDDYFADVLPVADAVMYEGYVLYPYRASSNKNRIRWNFGGVYPRSYSDAQAGADRSNVGSECLAIGADSELCVEIRFLELLERAAGEPLEARVRAHTGTPSASSPARGLHRRICVQQRAPARQPGAARRERSRTSEFKLRLRLQNESNCPAVEREHALPDTLSPRTCCSGSKADSSCLSSTRPLPAARPRPCVQRGLWPVLAGKKGRADRLLVSPIILYDYPEIAPESRADSCDATEIDEILLLRVLTLSDAKRPSSGGAIHEPARSWSAPKRSPVTSSCACTGVCRSPPASAAAPSASESACAYARRREPTSSIWRLRVAARPYAPSNGISKIACI